MKKIKKQFKKVAVIGAGGRVGLGISLVLANTGFLFMGWK